MGGRGQGPTACPSRLSSCISTGKTSPCSTCRFLHLLLILVLPFPELVSIPQGSARLLVAGLLVWSRYPKRSLRMGCSQLF